MTILFADGLDVYADVTDAVTNSNLSRSSTNTSICNYLTTGGRFGGGALFSTNSGQWRVPLYKAQNSTVIVTFAAFYSGLSGTGFVLMEFVNSADNIIGTLRFNSDGTLVFRPQNGAAGDVTAPGLPFTQSVWHSMEVKFVNGSNATNGSVIVRVDGVEVINASGIDTNDSTNTLIGIDFRHTIDDIVINDNAGSINNDFLGDVQIDTKLVTADGAVVDWTANTGSDFQAVDDALHAADGDTTYIASSTAAQKSRFAIADLTGTSVAIPAVQVRARAKKTDAGPTTWRSYLRSSGTEANGDTKGATTEYAWYRNHIRETDPNTSAAWTDAGVNALEVGVELVS